MKKRISILLCCFMAIALLSGCGNTSQNSTEDSNEKLSIVTTIFPAYDWTKQIVGEDNENVELTMLLDEGVDLHSFQPTTDDIITISTCDVFIYVGGESDEWVEDALEEAKNKDMKVINLLDVLGDDAKVEEVVEGMQDEHEEDDTVEDEHEEELEYDEHVWLSLKNAKILVSQIANTLSEADAENAETYQENASLYNDSLDALDKKYEEMVDKASSKTILFGDRFPFRYLADDYGLTYYAAFVGCSAETEASFETITFLAKKVDELKLGTVLTLEGSDEKIAKTIVGNSKSKDARISSMDSMQSTTSKDVEEGTTYLSLMEQNLDTLEKALN